MAIASLAASPAHRRRSLFVGAAAAALAAASLVLSPSSTPRAAAAIGGLTWADDFNGPAGTGVDGSRWGRDTGGGGFGNNELEFYTSGTSNAALDGAGHLVITAKRETFPGSSCWYGTCQYSSARLNTAGRFTQAFGRFEARIQIPRGQGIWPAFWMLGDNIGSVGWPNSGEIDIMENIGREPAVNHGSLHGPGYSGGSPLTGTFTLPGGGALADGFHIYAIEWGPDFVDWFVDGTRYSRHTPADTRGNPWVFNHPFFIIMNVAVGGNFPGSPNASTVFPQRMVVDYVHVFAWTTGGGGGGGAGAIRGLAGKCLDIAGGNAANGTAAQLFTCNDTTAQQWTATGGTLRALGKCLDVSGAGTADGTRVQLWDCNGTGAQQWQHTTGNDWINPASNKCLDVSGNNSADGTPLQIWTCTGATNQKWTTPGG